MKQFYCILTIALCLLVVNTFAQQVLLQQTVTDASKGQIVLTEKASTQSPINESVILGGTSKSPNINWRLTESIAIGANLRISQEAQKTFISWYLNNSRASLYGNSPTPIFEIPIDNDFVEAPIDMTADGLYLALGTDNKLRVFDGETHILIWEKDFEGYVLAFKIAEGGQKIYLAETEVAGEAKSRASAYIIGQDDPLWTTDFEGNATAFAISGDYSKIAFCQYTGVNKMHILNGENGEVIFDTFYFNEHPPAFSYDGKFIILGDYNGKAYLYEYDEDGDTYFEKWSFKVGGGGSSAWVVAASISADGSTVAIGTLVFLSADYNGEIYIFNTYSNEPIWVYEDCGDSIGSISLSDDGSLIAATTWGPMDHSKPDYFLFRKQSNVPIFTINTVGSLYSVVLSPDGTYCSVTGKRVHARMMGCGGFLYNINTDPGGGKLTGNIQLQGADSFENAKIVIEGIDNYYGYSDEEGNFEIKYIPAGSYTVTASKVGFYPDQTDVVIDEGGITTIDFSLLPTGNPPVNLSATQGADYTISLNWEHPDPSATTGFNIYRKSIAEELFPETPIATIDNNLLEFIDADVQPLITYYYVVTAIFDQDSESPYSNEVQGWMASGFMTNEISAYVGTTPVIDGTLSPGEWDDAFSLDVSDFYGTYDGNPNPVGSVTMYFKVNEEMTEFYVACIDQNTTVLQDNYTISLYIDDNNDHKFPATGINIEGTYWARYFASRSLIVYRPVYFGGGVGQILFIPDQQIAASDATGYVVMEFVIPMGDDEYWKLNPNEFNQSGLLTFNNDFDSYWPPLNQQILYPLTYGTITFGAEDEVPDPPTGTHIKWNSPTAPVTITMSWQQPPINDFDHFNIYMNEGSGFELLGETIGTQVFYTTNNTDSTLFHVTTVDKAGQESEPSENMIFNVPQSINEIVGSQFFNIYPNPSGNITNIKCEIVNPGFYSIRIFDLNGRLIQTLWEGDLLSGDHFFRWNGKNDNAVELTKGIYLINIKGGNVDITKKLIKL